MASAVSAVGSIFSGITASGVATAASVVGTGMSAYSIYRGGQDAEDSAQQQQASLYQTASENAYIANLNRQIAEREAVAIEGRGVAGVAMKRKEIAALLAYQRTQEAITGFRYEGTPVDIAYESAREGEEDVAMIWSKCFNRCGGNESKGRSYCLNRRENSFKSDKSGRHCGTARYLRFTGRTAWFSIYSTSGCGSSILNV